MNKVSPLQKKKRKEGKTSQSQHRAPQEMPGATGASCRPRPPSSSASSSTGTTSTPARRMSASASGTSTSAGAADPSGVRVSKIRKFCKILQNFANLLRRSRSDKILLLLKKYRSPRWTPGYSRTCRGWRSSTRTQENDLRSTMTFRTTLFSSLDLFS